MWLRGASIFLVYLCIASQAIEAYASSRSTYLFSQSELTKSLSQVSASEIFQDSQGFLWVLTQEGLNRFDGTQNQIFRADVNISDSLSGDSMRGVAEDSLGNLWFGTSASGINKFDPATQTFEVFRSGSDHSRSPLSDRISVLYSGSNGLVWIGYEDGGFSQLDPVTGLYRHFSPNRYQALSSFAVTSIVEVADGVALIATEGNGVLRLNASRDKITNFAGVSGAEITIGSNNIAALFVGGAGDIWVGTKDFGAYKIDLGLKVETFREVIDSLTGALRPLSAVFGFLEAKNGDLLLATSSGIAKRAPGSGTIVSIPTRGHDSSAERIVSIIQDKTGLYWAGGFRGVFTGFETSITTLSRRNGLPADNILSVARTSSGWLLVGTFAGVHAMPLQSTVLETQLLVLSEIGQVPVTAILAEENQLWIGAFQEGLFRIDLLTSETQVFHPKSESEFRLSDDTTTAIFRDSFGNLWVGTYAGGLNMMPAGENEFVSFRNNPNDGSSISSNAVFSIYQEKNGDLWVGTEEGLNRFNYDLQTFERFFPDTDIKGTISSGTIYSIYEDSKARLWIGTAGGGLNMWEPFDRKRSVNRFSYFQSNIGLPSSTVYAIQGDDQGNIWLSTSGGITRFNYDQNQSKNFTVDDGLQSNDFNLGASYRDSEGLLYFGGTEGLNYFDPARITTESVAPSIALTRISLGNEQVFFDVPYNELETIELQPDDYFLGFEFAALDFRAPHRNQYRYQMVGLDKNWVELGNRHTLDFSKLPMGQYVLRVQGSNPYGTWSPEGIALNIVVHPPVYLTWYAFATYIVALLLLVAAFFYRQRLRAQEQMQYQLQLEDDVRARTLDLRRSNEKLQIAAEEMGRARQDAELANQAKSEFLAALSHEIRTPMHGVLGMTDLLLHSGLNDRQLNFAESAHGSANELLGLIDNILDFSKIEAGKLELEETTFNLREMVENLCYLYGELAQSKNLELNLIFNLDLRRQLYGDPVRLRQVLQNLLSNAIKFTKRGSVNLTVNETYRRDKTLGIQFRVEDTGIGMNEETLENVFEAFSQADSSTTRQFGGTGLGLSIAKQLIDLMNGELEVNSRPGVGTTMSVDLSLVESPIYTEQLSTDGLEEYYAEVVAPMPETRAMFRSQLEAAGLRVHDCEQLEDLAAVAEHPRLVLIDTGCLYDGPSFAQVENFTQDASTFVVLITPLSGTGIPEELKHLPHTTKPARLSGLLSDLRAAESWEIQERDDQVMSLLRFDKRILLVEDIAANQEIARAMLESFGCTVAVARNGEVALEMFQQDDFDLVLMDCQMPVMDGFEATRHIRKLETQRPRGMRMPVVALTAGKTETEKERCYACGMDRILFKPYSTAELNELLSQYFLPVGQVEPRRYEKSIPTSTDLLDMKALDNIRNIDADTGGALLAAVFQNFKFDGKRKLDELREHSEDAAMLGAGAHAIKSMSLNIGAKALSEYCRRCESRWKSGRIEDAPREIELLAGHFRDAARALEQLLAADGEAVD